MLSEMVLSASLGIAVVLSSSALNAQTQQQDTQATIEAQAAQATQSNDTSADTDSSATQITQSEANSQDREIEEITVRGEQTFISIRAQITRAEDNLYSLFNDLNSKDEFDIFCRKTRSTYSYIPKRSCDPVFFTNARAVSAQSAVSEMRQAFSDGGVDIEILNRAWTFIEPESEIKQQVAKDYEDLNNEIQRIALENPDYLNALMQLGELKDLLRREREKVFGK
jgi:hypothetical protein